MQEESTLKNIAQLSDRQLLEMVLNQIQENNFGLKETNKRIDETNKRIDETNKRIDATNERIIALEQSQKAHFQETNQRLLQVEVQMETVMSLAHQSLSIAYAVRGEVRALREESAWHGREINELQHRTKQAA